MVIRLTALEELLASAAAESVIWPVIESLMALRGIDQVAAVTVLAGIGDLQRFASAPQLMAYLGMVPIDYSGGPSTRRGAITKTGNN